MPDKDTSTRSGGGGGGSGAASSTTSTLYHRTQSQMLPQDHHQASHQSREASTSLSKHPNFTGNNY